MVITLLRAAHRYILNVLIALDQLASTLIGGDPDETLSSRLGKAVRGDYGRFQSVFWRTAAWLVDLVFLPFDGPEHCRRMVEEDEGAHAIDFDWMGRN